jgi:cell volume regulation protein A
VPIVLATIPLSAHAPGAADLFDLVFVVVVVFTLLQGPTLPCAARRLKVTTPAEPLEIDVEATSHSKRRLPRWRRGGPVPAARAAAG